jgi:hypothetical protein
MFSIYVDDKGKMISADNNPSIMSGPEINPGNKGSKLLLGGYDMEKYAVGPIAFHDVDPEKIWWTTTLGMLSFVGTKKADAANQRYNNIGAGSKIIFDSGTSFLMIPNYQRDILLEFLIKEQGLKCKVEGLIQCSCKD